VIGFIPFQVVTDEDMLRMKLFNLSRLSEDGCWVWAAARDGHGYGMVNRGNKTLRAHRVSYVAFKGEEIPAGMVVRHTCDNPACINPGHLLLGAQAENVAGRDARGRRDVRGENVGILKLTREQVEEIKASDLTGVALAKKFGVSTSAVSLIKNNKSWSHVNINTEA
jgi:hypothetical protein